MANKFFVRISGDIQGPFDAAKVRQLAVAGRLGGDDELSRDRQQWTRARNVKGLVFAAASPSPRSQPAVNGATASNGANGGAANPARQADSKRTLTAHRPASNETLQSSGRLSAVEVRLPANLGRTANLQLAVNLTACPDCGQYVSLRASDCPHCGAPIRQLPARPQTTPKHRLLRLMSSAYAALGIVVTVAAAFMAVVLIYFITQGDASGATASFLALVACITGGITCFAVSEAMQVFLQIEQNTRAARLTATRGSVSELGG